MAEILAIKTGKVRRTVFADGSELNTAIRKTPVEETRIGTEGIAGNEVGLTAHHGGPDKALFFMAESSIAALNRFCSNPDGCLGEAVYGENFVVSEWDENHICIGDLYRIGSAVVEISQPRRPCSRLSKSSDCPEMQRFVFESGLTGWYARVTEGGLIRRGDRLTLLARPHPQWSVKRLNGLLSGSLDIPSCQAALECEPLAAAFKRALAGKLDGAGGMVAG